MTLPVYRLTPYQAAGSLAAIAAAGLLFPVAVMLCHLIGSRRGPLLPIATGFSLVALCPQAVAAATWLFVLPRLARDGGPARSTSPTPSPLPPTGSAAASAASSPRSGCGHWAA